MLYLCLHGGDSFLIVGYVTYPFVVRSEVVASPDMQTDRIGCLHFLDESKIYLIADRYF